MDGLLYSRELVISVLSRRFFISLMSIFRIFNIYLADIQHLTINAYCFRYASPAPGTRLSMNTLSTLAALFGGQPR
jgi:hypothetical protein